MGRLGKAPALGCRAESGLMFRPVVESARVKVGSARPHDRMNFLIKNDLGKNSRIAKRTEKLALKNRLKINRARQTVVKEQAQRVWLNALNGSDAVNGMFHNNGSTAKEGSENGPSCPPRSMSFDRPEPVPEDSAGESVARLPLPSPAPTSEAETGCSNR